MPIVENSDAEVVILGGDMNDHQKSGKNFNPDLHNIHNYFNLHVCPSLRRRRRPVRPTFEFPIPAVVLQSVTNKSCLIFVKSEKYAFLVTTRPPGSMR